MILALIIAGVSLPTSVVSMINTSKSQNPEINNYNYNNTVIETYNNTVIYNNTLTETYNNTIIERYNDTIIITVNNTVIVNETISEEDPMPDRSKRIEEHYFRVNTTDPIYIIGNYTMGANEIYFLDSVRMVGRAQEYPTFFVIEDIWFDIWNETDGEIGQFYSPGDGHSSYWTPAYLSNWLIIATVDDAYIPNNWDYTIYDSITTIGL